ncbi:MAG: transporter substrate-binding domain-containing protein [Mariprofundaceae bacterium]
MRQLFAVCTSVVWACLSIGLASAEGDIVNLEANESPPYWSASLPYNGMAGEIVHAISQEAGLVSNIHYKPLKRLIEDDNNNDLGNPAFYMRNQDFAAVVPIAVYYVSIFYYKEKFREPIRVKSMADLKGYRVGVLKGTVVSKAAFERSGVQFEESYTQASLFKKLKRGRIDLCVEIDLVGHQVIRNLFPDEIDAFEEIKLVGSASPIAIMVAQNSANPAKLGERYSQGLKRIIESGKYNKILESYYDKGHVPEGWFHQLKKFQQIYNFNLMEPEE